MKFAKLEDMQKGWFVGNFLPTAHQTEAFEVAVKQYSAGEKETSHRHQIATEITVIVSGNVHMAGRDLSEGDIIVINPGESTNFEAYTDCITVVVKTPSAPNDKYSTN